MLVSFFSPAYIWGHVLAADERNDTIEVTNSGSAFSPHTHEKVSGKGMNLVEV
jgi:hypothetical protein